MKDDQPNQVTCDQRLNVVEMDFEATTAPIKIEEINAEPIKFD